MRIGEVTRKVYAKKRLNVIVGQSRALDTLHSYIQCSYLLVLVITRQKARIIFIQNHNFHELKDGQDLI